MKGLEIIVLYTIVLFFPSISTTEEDRFFWSAEYVSKPNNFYHGAPTQIPVIKGEEVDIQCQVRAVSEDTYTIIWDYEDFNAITSGKTVLVNNTAGDEYAVDTIKVNITNPDIIDDKDIICSWENGQFSDTISLQFKVYVEDKSPGICPDCKGTRIVKLRRPENQKKEDANLEKMIKEKAKKTYDLSIVYIEFDGSVCGCQTESTTPSTKIRKKPMIRKSGRKECRALGVWSGSELMDLWCSDICSWPILFCPRSSCLC